MPSLPSACRAVLPRALALGLLLLGAGALEAKPEAKVFFDYVDRGYARLDPAWAREGRSEQRLLLALFEGLTRLDPATGRAVPAAAERWEVSPDGRTWTFTLRADGAWTDGTPVTAADFVRGWRRVLDPDVEETSPWRPLFRPLRGAASILDNDFGRRVLDAFQRALQDALEAKKDGIPGADLRELVHRVGLKAVPGIPEQPVLRRMLRWGEDKFTAKQMAEVLEVIKSERKKRKTPTFEGFDAFGTTQGVRAKDARTLVVETEGWVPYLPELLARSCFAPWSGAMTESREIGEDTDRFVTNGPFKLHKRGSKPRGDARTPSTVHLVRSPAWKGPPAGVDEIRCWTDEGVAEELRRFKDKEIQWIPAPEAEARKQIEALPGYRTRPAASVVFLRFRCDSAPFEKPEARRAFAAGLDRAALAKLLWPAGDPAERLLPPKVRGAAPGVKAPTLDGAGAKKALAASGFGGDKFPFVNLRYAEGLDALAERLVTQWDKTLEVGVGHQYEEGPELVRTLRGGTYEVCLSVVSGAYDDPAAFLEGFASSSPDGGLGWRDEALDAFLAAARDVEGAAKAPERLLALARSPATKAALEALKATPGAAQRDAARQALLGEAEQRLLDEVVVVPLLYPRAAEVLGDVKGLGEEAAWQNGGFLGSLRDARR